MSAGIFSGLYPLPKNVPGKMNWRSFIFVVFIEVGQWYVFDHSVLTWYGPFKRVQILRVYSWILIKNVSRDGTLVRQSLTNPRHAEKSWCRQGVTRIWLGTLIEYIWYMQLFWAYLLFGFLDNLKSHKGYAYKHNTEKIGIQETASTTSVFFMVRSDITGSDAL